MKNRIMFNNSHLTPVQQSAYLELHFNETQAKRFTNKYQVVAYIATRNVDLSLTFNSIDAICDYFSSHKDQLENALGLLTIRSAGNSAIGRNAFNVFAPSLTYPNLVDDLLDCLKNIYNYTNNNDLNNITEPNTPQSDNSQNNVKPLFSGDSFDVHGSFI